MKLICDLSDQSFKKNPQNIDRSGYTVRKAARAVMINNKEEVALMWIEKYKMYKLPGGGVNDNEDIHEGLKRELLEETGFHAQIGDEIGMTIEFRDEWKMSQISYCYKATAVENTGESKLDLYEVDEGFEVRWIPIHEAEKLMKEHTSEEYDPKFMQPRDLKILQAALREISAAL